MSVFMFFFLLICIFKFLLQSTYYSHRMEGKKNKRSGIEGHGISSAQALLLIIPYICGGSPGSWVVCQGLQCS